MEIAVEIPGRGISLIRKWQSRRIDFFDYEHDLTVEKLCREGGISWGWLQVDALIFDAKNEHLRAFGLGFEPAQIFTSIYFLTCKFLILQILWQITTINPIRNIEKPNITMTATTNNATADGNHHFSFSNANINPRQTRKYRKICSEVNLNIKSLRHDWCSCDDNESVKVTSGPSSLWLQGGK